MLRFIKHTMSVIGSTAVALSVSAATPMMADTTELKMVLEWRYQGPQAWYFLAQDRGYFAAENLEVVIDQGSGSAATVGKVASGAYDVGFGDSNALIQLASQNPEEAPVCVYQVYNKPPFTVAVLTESDIYTPKDLEGRKLGGAANDGALKLFPAFASVADIDTSDIEILNFQPNLREQMLKREQVEGVFGFVNTIRFSAKLAGIDPDADFRFINYGDYGMDLYSNCVMASQDLITNNPEAVRGLVRAINRGIAAAIEDPEAAIEAVARREGLINKEIELERMFATLEFEMDYPGIAEHGAGDIDPERFSNAIDLVVQANNLTRTPALEEVFTTEFLPPREERLFSFK